MKALFKHNMTTGWRNVLKYKTQNIISVLCLSVGVLCFAIAMYFINITWVNYMNDIVEGHKVTVHAQTDEKGLVYTDYSMLKQMESLKAVKSVVYQTYGLNTRVEIESAYTGVKPDSLSFWIVSRNWLKENNFRLVTTGKHIGDLKPGTIVMSRRCLKRMYNNDPENILGNKATLLGKTGKISDVVYSDTYYGYVEDVMIVASDDLAPMISVMNVDILLNDGYTVDDLEKQLSAKMPKVKWNLHDFHKNNSPMLMVLLLIFLVFLGASVLIIGLAGFLKMQLQLFILRTQEMALRRCNGAKPMELFMLLCAELLIVFVFVAVVSMLISLAFEAYSMPMLNLFGLTTQLDFNPGTIYITELLITGLAFIVSVVIAWLTVRRNLKVSLASNVKSNFTQRTKWNGAMQVTQYVVAIVLFYFISLMFFTINKNSKRFNLPVSPSYYKNIVCSTIAAGSELCEDISKLPSVEMSGKSMNVFYRINNSTDSTSNEVPRRWDVTTQEVEDTICLYEGVVADVSTMKMLKVGIQKDYSLDDDHTFRVPVYVQRQNVANVKKGLGLDYETENAEYTLPDGRKYMMIGIAELMPVAKMNFGQIGFYIIDDSQTFIAETGYDGKDKFEWFFMPKDKKTFAKDVDKLYHQKEPALPEEINITLPTAYDRWFSEFRLMNFLMQLLSLLTFVSLLSIVLTVFSSISLETRGKQREVAIRKVNGAKIRDIVMLFSRFYVVTLSIAFFLALLIGFVIIAIISISENDWPGLNDLFTFFLPPFIVSIAVITTVTVATIWQKIYNISHINPATLIRKE